jgi:hypothetical protein
MVLHTSTTCSVSGRDQTAPQKNTDCAFDTGGSGGCDVDDTRPLSYGDAFNANAGGYYVMEWTDAAIKMWFFPRGTQPVSLLGSMPDTATFGTPVANFAGDCDVAKSFLDQRFIFNTNCEFLHHLQSHLPQDSKLQCYGMRANIRSLWRLGRKRLRAVWLPNVRRPVGHGLVQEICSGESVCVSAVLLAGFEF